MKTATLKNMVNGVEVRVHATTEHPDSHYGQPVWVDDEGTAYCQVGLPSPFYQISNVRAEYRIVAQCDPYNARKHYNGQQVLERDGATPVKWVMSDGYTSEEEAKKALMDLAMTGNPYENGGWSYEDEDSVKYLAEAIKEDHPDDFEDGEEPDTSWFKGPGIYDHTGGTLYPVLLEGETSFRDDTMMYSIEEA